MLLRAAAYLGLLTITITLFNPFSGSKSYVYAGPREHLLMAEGDDPGRYFPTSWVHKVSVMESTHYRLYTTLLNSEEARTFLTEELEPIYSEFQRLFPFSEGESRTPLAVVLLRD